MKKDYIKLITNIDFEKQNNINYLINDIVDYNKIKNKEFNEIILKENLYEEIKDSRKILKLNNVITHHKDLYLNRPILVSELGGINKYDNFYTDYTLNVTNSYSVYFLHLLGSKKVTLSVELNDEQILMLINNYHKRYNNHPNLEILFYGKELAMTLKYKLLKNSNKGYLIDRFKNEFPIYIEDGLTKIYNYKTRDLVDKEKYFKMGINNLRIEIL